MTHGLLADKRPVQDAQCDIRNQVWLVGMRMHGRGQRRGRLRFVFTLPQRCAAARVVVGVPLARQFTQPLATFAVVHSGLRVSACRAAGRRVARPLHGSTCGEPLCG